ncbi:DUF167-domain-containing protein [Xylariaceae sp. FL1651]|nr:DUF167-domain-containing protein [Xylariaceae sp. FL1651]
MTAQVAISLIRKKSSAKILQLRCHVRPGASKAREGIVAITEEVIEVCVSAPAQDGKANKAVLETLSEALGTAKTDLQITNGLKSRDKTISVSSAPFIRDQTDETDIVELVRKKLLSAASSR